MGMEQIKHLSNAFKGVVFSCQNHRFKDFNCQYIHPISCKIAKKANSVKWICPIENCTYAIRAKMSDISQVFEVDDIFIFWMAI